MTPTEERIRAALVHASEATRREAQRAGASSRPSRRIWPVVASAACVLAIVAVVATVAARHGTKVPKPTGQLATAGSASPTSAATLPSAQLTGRRWFPATTLAAPASGAYIEFFVDGTWEGSDGCNHFGGTYGYSAAGAFHAVLGGTTLAGCNVPQIGDWITRATRADIDGNELKLIGADGQLIGTLTS